MGINELAAVLGLNRSTTHRYVSTLKALGYLEQDAPTRKYRLGVRVLDLGFSAIDSMELRAVAFPHLRWLSEETGHTTNMAILDGNDIVYIERVRSDQPGQREIDLNLHTGSRLPAHCTAMGKILLANLPEPQLNPLLDQLQPTKRGPNTITSRAQLVAELRRVRSAGIAVNNEELAYGLRAIAAPICARSGTVVAAINLAVHGSVVPLDTLTDELSPALLRAARDISAWITFQDPQYQSLRWPSRGSE
jgi:IclR family pca regulon transcriptional regulator